MNAKQIAKLLPEVETNVQVRFLNGNVTFSWEKKGFSVSTSAEVGGEVGDWDTIVKLSQKTFEEFPKTPEVFFRLNDKAELEIGAGRETKTLQSIQTTINKLPVNPGEEYFTISLNASQWEMVKIAAEVAMNSEVSPLNCVVFQLEIGYLNLFGGYWGNNRDTILWGQWPYDTNVSVLTLIPAHAVLSLVKEKDETVHVDVSPDGKIFGIYPTSSKMIIFGWVPQQEYPRVPATIPAKSAYEPDAIKLELSKAETKKLGDALRKVSEKYPNDVPIVIEVKDKTLTVSVEGGDNLTSLPVKTDFTVSVTLIFSALLEMFKGIMIAQGIAVLFPGAPGEFIKLVLQGVGAMYLASVIKNEVISKDDPETVKALTKIEVDLAAPPKVEKPKLPENLDEAIAACESTIATIRLGLVGTKPNSKQVEKAKADIALLEEKLEVLYKARAKGETQVPDLQGLYTLLLKVIDLQQQILEEMRQRFPMPEGVGKYTTYVKVS